MKTAKWSGAVIGGLFLLLVLCGALSATETTVNQDSREWFIIQAASFLEKRNALNAYETLQRKLGSDVVVRVEHLPPYYTLRVGLSESKGPIRELLADVKTLHPTAIILRVHVDPERIVSMTPSGATVLATASGNPKLDVAWGAGEADNDPASASVMQSVPETAITEAAVTEAAVSEAALTEAAITEAAVSEAAVPEAAVSEVAVSEVAVPKAAVSEAALTEATITEAAVPEAAVSEVAVPEVAVPEVAVPEAAVPEAALTEAAVQDAADSKASEDGPSGVPLLVEPAVASEKTQTQPPAPLPEPDVAATPEFSLASEAQIGAHPAKEDRTVDIAVPLPLEAFTGRQWLGVGQESKVNVAPEQHVALPEPEIPMAFEPVWEAASESGNQGLDQRFGFLKQAGIKKIAGFAGLGIGVALLLLTSMWFMRKGRGQRDKENSSAAQSARKCTLQLESCMDKPFSQEDMSEPPLSDAVEEGMAVVRVVSPPRFALPQGHATAVAPPESHAVAAEAFAVAEERQSPESMENGKLNVSQEKESVGTPIPLGPAPEHARHHSPYAYQSDMERRIADGEMDLPGLSPTGEAFMKRGAVEFEVMVKNILRRSADQELTSIYVTSCSAGEGKTRVSMALAHFLAREGYRVLLVDANTVAPLLHDVYNTSFSPGLLEALNGSGFEARDAIRPSRHENLHIMTLGSKPLTGALRSEGFPLNALIEALAEDFEFVILDGQSLSEPFALFVASTCDGTVVVTPWEKPKWHTIKKSAQEITLFGGTVIGLVQNKRPVYLPGFIFRKPWREQYVEVRVESGRTDAAMPPMAMGSPMPEVEDGHKALRQ